MAKLTRPIPSQIQFCLTSIEITPKPDSDWHRLPAVSAYDMQRDSRKRDCGAPGGAASSPDFFPLVGRLL